MEAILHKIQNFITGFMLVNSNLAKAVEFIEYGTYISLAVILLGLLGFFGLARKNNPLVKAVGAASLFALFPAWFIIGEMGLIGLLAVILIVSIVLNRQSPDTRGRNFLMSSMLAGFAISVVSFFIGFTYLREGNQIDPAENGVYGLAPFMTFLFSFLIFSRREKKAARAGDSFMEDQWQPQHKSISQQSVNAAYANGGISEPSARSNVYPSDEERLPSLEELFSKGVDEQSFNTIFDRPVEQKLEEKPLFSEAETDYSFLDAMQKEKETSEPIKAVEEKIEETGAAKASMPIGSILAPSFDGRDDEFLSSSRRKEEVKINFFESEKEEGVLGAGEEKPVDPIETPVAKSDLSQTLLFDDMAEQIESELQHQAEIVEDEATEKTVIAEPTAQTVEESVAEDLLETLAEATSEEVVSQEAMKDVEEFEVEIVKLDFLEPKAEEPAESVAEVAEEAVAEATEEEAVVEEPAAEAEEVEIVKLDFLEPKAEEPAESVAEVAEEAVAEATEEEAIVEEPVAEAGEVEIVKLDFLEPKAEEPAEPVAEVAVAKTDLTQTLVFEDMAEQIESELQPAVETVEEAQTVAVTEGSQEVRTDFAEQNAEVLVSEIAQEEAIMEQKVEETIAEQVEEISGQQEEVDSVFEELIASLEKFEAQQIAEREQRGNIVDYSHVFAQAGERAIAMDTMQAAYLGHTINYDVRNITDFKSRFGGPFRTEDLPTAEDLKPPANETDIEKEIKSEDPVAVENIEQDFVKGEQILQPEQIVIPAVSEEKLSVNMETQTKEARAIPLHINISGLENADADIIENDGENIILSIKLSNKKSKMVVDDIKVERQAEEPKVAEGKSAKREAEATSGMPKFISLSGVPKFVAPAVPVVEGPRIIAGVPKFMGIPGTPKFAGGMIKSEEMVNEPAEDVVNKEAKDVVEDIAVESKVEEMEVAKIKAEEIAVQPESVVETTVEEPVAIMEAQSAEPMAQSIPYEPQVGTASPNFVKISGVPSFIEPPKEKIVEIEETVSEMTQDPEIESVFTIPVETFDNQVDFMTANGLELPKIPQANQNMGATAQYTKQELGLDNKDQQAPGASQEMGIFCNEQEEYYRSQYYFLKTQVDFYEKQMGYYQKQLSVSESQLQFYAQQADMYLKQADFYRVKKKED